MNSHLEKAIETYGDSFQQLLTWHICHGVVVCGPEFFAMGYHSHHSDPAVAVGYPHCDTLFATFCAGDMRRALLGHSERYDFIAFQRSFTNRPCADRFRLIPMADFLSKLTT